MNDLCVLNQETDILIIGGGLTGASLLLALENSGYRALLVEAKDFSAQSSHHLDARTLALSPASRNILQMLNLWSHIEKNITAIKKIHVSEQHCFGSTRLTGSDDESLGYVLELEHINNALYKILDKEKLLQPARFVGFNDQQEAQIQLRDKVISIRYKIIVAADGLHSAVRPLTSLAIKKKNYHQVALITNIALARPHQGLAFERFTSVGPMAVLPMSDQRAALVWTLTEAKANELFAVEEKIFLQHLQKAFGYKLGRFLAIGKRQIYPLQQALMPKQVAWPFVFVGNAAHHLHPVAGQGFNLGLRDVAALAQCIIEHGLQPLMLNEYEKMRQYDQKAIAYFCDGLVELFRNRLPIVGSLRRWGLLAMDNLPFLQKVVTHHARGFAGVIPDLVCGIPLLAENSVD